MYKTILVTLDRTATDRAIIEHIKSLAKAMHAVGIEDVDESAVVELCRRLVAANPKIVAEVKEGKLKGVGALIGQAKKENPNANANRVRELCLEIIQQSKD